MTHTASLAYPPAQAFDRGEDEHAPWAVVEERQASLGFARALELLAGWSADRALQGMEVQAEWVGISYYELGDGRRLVVKMCPVPNECGEKPYHYFAPLSKRSSRRHLIGPKSLRWTSRERVLGLIAEHKRELAA